MAEGEQLVVGHDVNWGGDITQLRAIGAKSARAIERTLGYAPGRLAAGWHVLLLKRPLTPEDFIFGGLALRSAGRYGLPAATEAEDRDRPHVHESMLREIGTAATRERQVWALKRIPEKGLDRLAKVVPGTRHAHLPPNQQYPMGDAVLQWTLVRECPFLVAAAVDAHGVARMPGFAAFVGESATSEDRARMVRYLEGA